MFGGGKLVGSVGCTGLPAFGRWLGRGGGTRNDELSETLLGVCLTVLWRMDGNGSGKFPSPYTEKTSKNVSSFRHANPYLSPITNHVV